MRPNAFFQAFIQSSRATAALAGLDWNVPTDALGVIVKGHEWKLHVAVGVPRSSCRLFRQLGADRRTAELLGLKPEALPFNSDWTDLIKAVVVDWVVVRRNSLQAMYDSRIRPLRMLATCFPDVPPWALGPAQVRFALGNASKVSLSSRLNLQSSVSRLLDAQNLLNAGPVLQLALAGEELVRRRPLHDQNSVEGTGQIRKALAERKSPEKLPDTRAFWELLRIVTEENPACFTDAVFFEEVRLFYATGFRISEHCLLPLNWRVDRKFQARDGRSASDAGGEGGALGIRHFAMKQRGEGEDSNCFYETVQWVPQRLAELVEGALNRLAELTKPLRMQLQDQAASGRLFPQYGPGDLVRVAELYPCLSGNVRVTVEDLPEELLLEYRRNFDLSSLEALREWQRGRPVEYRRRVASFFRMLSSRHGDGLPFRCSQGLPMHGTTSWAEAHLRVDELEAFLRAHVPKRIPDMTPYRVGGGKLELHELLVLVPMYNSAVYHHDLTIDVERYYSIRVQNERTIAAALGKGPQNLFSRYGRTEESRSLRVTKTHAFRHLLTSELLARGVSDAIIGKHMDRRSVVQNRVYDHRSLAEELEAMDVPEPLRNLSRNLQDTVKLVVSGRVAGPLVRRFRKIQSEEGEEAALEFLAVEADGFHVTPYGYCTNSFLVDPCPAHLECFNGCRHLQRSDDPSEQAALVAQKARMERAEAAILANPEDTPGKQNQLRNVRAKIVNLATAIALGPGDRPFADGPDLSHVVGGSYGGTVLDG